mgnify:CR=1 FL=1
MVTLANIHSTIYIDGYVRVYTGVRLGTAKLCFVCSELDEQTPSLFS